MSKSAKYITLVLVSAMAGMMYLTPFLRFTFYDQMVDALGVTDVQLGTISSFYGIFSTFLYLLSGAISEKFSTKSLVLFSGFGMALTTAWYAMFPGYLALCLIHGLFGILSVGVYWCAYIKAVRELGDASEQGRLYGNSEAIRGVIQALVSFSCLAIVNKFVENGLGFRITLVINAVMFLVLTIACMFVLPKEEKTGKEKVAAAENNASEGGLIKQYITLLKNPALWICTTIVITGFTIWETSNSYMGTFTTRVLGLSAGMASTLSIIRSNVIVILAGVIGGIIMDKFSSKGKGLIVFYSLIILSVIGVMLTTSVPMLCVAITLILAFVCNVVKSAYWSIMDEAGVPRQGTGLATGLISTVAYTPDIFIFFVIPQFLSYGERINNIHQGFNLVLLWLIAFSAIGLIGAIFLMRRSKYTLKNNE